MRFLLTVFLFFSLLYVTSPIYASHFTLTKIGRLSTDGFRYKQWWYTGTKPSFVGTATPGSPIEVVIDGISVTISANGNGDWSFTPANILSIGDHNISIGSNGEFYTFTLTIGSAGSDDANSSSPSGELPRTGNVLSLVGIATLAVTLIAVSLKYNT